MENEDKKENILNQEKNSSYKLENREAMSQDNNIESLQATIADKLDQETLFVDKKNSPESTLPATLDSNLPSTNLNERENNHLITNVELPSSPCLSDFSDYIEMDLENVPHISDYASHILSEEEIKANLSLDDANISSYLNNLEESTKQLSWVKHHPYNFGLTSKELNEFSSPLDLKTKLVDDLKLKKQKDSYRQHNKNKNTPNFPPMSVNNSQNTIHSSNNSSPQASGTRPNWPNDQENSSKRNFSYKKQHNGSSKYEPNNRYKPTNPKPKAFKPSKVPVNKRPNDKDLTAPKTKFPKKKNKSEKDKNSERNSSRSNFNFEKLLQSTAQSLDNEPSETSRRGSYMKTKEHNT